MDLHPARRRAGDTVEDLYPGSGAVSRAWAAYTSGEASCHGYPSCQAGADASSPAASDTSDPLFKASPDAYAQLPLEFAR
jgi:hypothetical protein